VNQIVGNHSTGTVLETNFGDQAQFEYVPYGLLCRSPSNVCKKAPTGIEKLAITIEAKGLRQINRKPFELLHRLATDRLIVTSQDVTQEGFGLDRNTHEAGPQRNAQLWPSRIRIAHLYTGETGSTRRVDREAQPIR